MLCREGRFTSGFVCGRCAYIKKPLSYVLCMYIHTRRRLDGCGRPKRGQTCGFWVVVVFVGDVEPNGIYGRWKV